jgi:sporulation related protein
LHLQWAALKANFGPALAGLRPTAAREQRGTSTVYRLVVGPLPNMASATKLCARLTAARAVCHTGKFSGDPL